MPVDRCICHRLSFREIKKISEDKGLQTVEELQEKKICATNCRLCVPYLKVLLKTGQTSFTTKPV